MSKIENRSIFYNYEQTENQVTAALLQIFKAGGTEFIAGVLSETEAKDFPSYEIDIITQEKENKNVYDGLLQCGFAFQVFVESKIKRNSINKKQLEGLISNAKTDADYILYITPDDSKPQDLPPGICWVNWREINNILKKINPETEPVNFLINEFEKYLYSLGLLESPEQRVQIAAGSWGEPVAKEYGIYACQSNRNIRQSKYLAFYNNGGIHSLFEILGEVQNDCDLRTLDDEQVKRYLAEKDPNYTGYRQYYKLKFVQELNIQNDTLNKHGKKTAYTMGVFRYTTIDKIKEAKTTSEL